MPGMNSGLSVYNPTLVTAFRTALLHQAIIVLAVFAVLALAWVSVREWLPAARTARAEADQPARADLVSGTARRARTGLAARAGLAARPGLSPEAAGRRFLRVGFGLVWIFDGILQGQPAMAAGLPSQVMEPSAAGSPGWVQHLVNWAGTGWSYHPIQAGAAAVWIQVGIGAWLIAAPPGRPARFAGLVSAGWGLVVWVFGEAFGGIFAAGQSMLFGTPGAALVYCAAGLLIALPERSWQSARLGRQVLAGLGAFFLAMAALQAWPGRGFWQGDTRHGAGALSAMVTSMATTPQPRFLAALLRAFASFAAANGFAVNLFVVVALVVAGAGLLTGQPRLIRPALALAAIICLAAWVLVQDFGFLGGLGTDPNSMIPILLLAAGGWVAFRRPPDLVPAGVAGTTEPPDLVPAGVAGTTEPAGQVPAAVAGTTEPPAPAPAPEPAGLGAGRLRPVRSALTALARSFGSVSVQAVVAIWAAAIVLIGAGPMMVAQASPNADPIIAEAIDGTSAPLDYPAPGFTLTDQNGHQVSLASLHGKTVLLTFLDPVCTSDCPLIAQEFRAADRLLGASAGRAELVAIVANPIYYSVAYTRAFDSQEAMSGLPNWLFLTGSLQQLQAAWKNYAIAAQILPAGGMIAHSDVAYVIDADGHTRRELDFDPGPGTPTSVSSFAVELSTVAQNVMRSP
jgi:cytochrome oxidase Cu insertion factor (SCO1/SenC/PrrC family)